MVESELEELLARAGAHVHLLVTGRQSRARVHGSGRLGRLNAQIARRITLAVGTMWAAYAFVMLALVSLPAAIRSGDLVILIAWISQTFLQLVLLSIIMVGQQVLAAATDARAEADHATITLLHRINVVQLKILQEQQRMLLDQQLILVELQTSMTR